MTDVTEYAEVKCKASATSVPSVAAKRVLTGDKPGVFTNSAIAP
jgi:hypothetical protein